MLGHGRADHRADVAEPASAGHAELIDEARDALPEGAARRELDVLELRGTRIGGSYEHENAGSGRDQRLERVTPQQGVGRKRVGPEPRYRTERRGRAARERLRVGRGCDRHIAALAVGDHDEPRRVRRRHDLV